MYTRSHSQKSELPRLRILSHFFISVVYTFLMGQNVATEKKRERLILEEYKTAQWRSSSTFFLISCRDKRSSAAVPTGWNQHLLQCETTVSALCQEFAAGHLLCALVTFLLHFPTLKSESSFFKWPGDRIAPAQRGLTAAPPFIANQRS
jgi:hypothetical protein